MIRVVLATRPRRSTNSEPRPGPVPAVCADNPGVTSVEEIRARRPQQAMVVRWLSIGATVLWLPVIGYLYIMGPALTLFVCLYVFGAFGVAKGRQAARIMATVGLAMVYVVLLPYCVVGFSDPYPYSTVNALIDIAAVAVSGFSLVWMYHPNTNRYVHLVTAARRSPPPG